MYYHPHDLFQFGRVFVCDMANLIFIISNSVVETRIIFKKFILDNTFTKSGMEMRKKNIT